MTIDILPYYVLWVLLFAVIENSVIPAIMKSIGKKPLVKSFIIFIFVIGIIGSALLPFLIASETRYTIVDVQMSECSSELKMTVQDEEGNAGTVSVEADNIKTSQRNDDCLVVRKCLAGGKWFIIECSEQSEFLQLYEEFQLQQELLE